MAGSYQNVPDDGAPRAIISFPLDNSIEPSFENLHGIFRSGDEYILDNSPFYVYGVSLGDVVKVIEAGRRLLFDSVVERGGHSTYRLKLPPGKDHEHFLAAWPALERLGCSYEASSANARRLYSLDIPPRADVKAVYDALEQGESNGTWEFEEAHYHDPRQ